MLSFFAFARDMSALAVTVRLVAAVLCGGLIGMEREFKRRPAGFRTHILICLGAAMTTLTSQYLFLTLKMYTDVARLGAQVIAGIGFIGGGAIVITNRQRVKGLTTAAGLWTDAIIGLVCGAGYIEGGLIATALVLVAETLLIKLEYKFARTKTDLNIYIEYRQPECIEAIVHEVKRKHINITGLEITRTGSSTSADLRYCAVLTVQAKSRKPADDLVSSLSNFEGVITLEEL